MNQPPQESQASLEDQLRNMILGNVTLSNSNRGGQEGSLRGQHHRHPHRNRQSYPRGPLPNERWQGPPQRGGASPAFNQGRGTWKPRAHHQRQHGGGANGVHGDIPPFDVPHQSYPRQRNQPNQHHQPPNAAGQSGPRVPQRVQQPGGYSNRGPVSPMGQFPPQHHAYSTHSQQKNHQLENSLAQVEHLDSLASQEVPKVELSMAELEEKEAFRKQLECICKDAMAQDYSGPIDTIDLVGFGSLASGFGIPGSDMDLAIVLGWKDSADTQEVERVIPRLLEKAILASNMGGRLLTKTRVPILKVCQRPSEELYHALSDERRKWDEMPEEEKYAPPQPLPGPASAPEGRPVINVDGDEFPALGQQPKPKTKPPKAENDLTINVEASNIPKSPGPRSTASNRSSPPASTQSTASQGIDTNQKDVVDKKKPWLREKVLGPLDFPKTGVGIQCDINFGNPLGIHNTHLLRCYSLCDPRVRPMVLFVKAWAKRRKINSAYSGTLSSYGWVLMVLHYLVNVAQPPVCPNLQHCYRQPTDIAGLEKMFKETMIAGYPVRFWRDEAEIMHAAREGQLTRNTESLGALLRGFFHYFASPNTGFVYGARPPAFYWTTEVLSLRTPHGILSKQSKGWTGAKTTIQAGKEVRNRYLFAIEDPFELDHNVARTVTHNGIVAIRDEFRRVWRILQAVARDMQPEGGIFADVVEQVPPPMPEKVVETAVATAALVVEGGKGESASDQKENDPSHDELLEKTGTLAGDEK